MRTLIGIALAILLLLRLGFVQGGSPALGSIRGDVFTKGTNGEPAVLPGAPIALHGRITKETESDAQGAFAVDGLPPAGTSSTVPVEMNVAAVTSMTSPQLTWLEAMDCVFGRKVHHA